MAHFRTIVSPGVSPQPITVRDAVATLGSCFADAIGNRLVQCKFTALSNPFGVIYNPFSIHNTVRRAIFREPAPRTSFLQRGDVHLSYDFHSVLSDLSPERLQQRLDDITGTTHRFLAGARWLLLTYGTAFVYTRNDTGEVVANCHKQPASFFRRSLLSPQQVEDSFGALHRALKAFNPALRVILTVSPVRHLKETLEGNSVSKSILRLACHNIAQAHADVEYFAAYEMMLDDLRDYRFYQSDMLHPTPQAEDYIWDQFAARYFDDDTKQFLEQWAGIQRAMAHRPFHPQSAAHQQFLHATLQQLVELKNRVNVDNEIEALKKQLIP